MIDFYGFDPKYKRDFLSIEQVIEKVEPLIRNAGYTVVKRHDVHDNGRDWANVKVVIYRLIVNSNTATGLYSYVGSVNVFSKDALGTASRDALDTNPLWTRGYNGFGPPSELGLGRLLRQDDEGLLEKPAGTAALIHSGSGVATR